MLLPRADPFSHVRGRLIRLGSVVAQQSNHKVSLVYVALPLQSVTIASRPSGWSKYDRSESKILS